LRESVKNGLTYFSEQTFQMDLQHMGFSRRWEIPLIQVSRDFFVTLLYDLQDWKNEKSWSPHPLAAARRVQKRKVKSRVLRPKRITFD
jgi:hypothetical protein